VQHLEKVRDASATRDIKQFLIGLGILYHRRGLALALDREYDGTLALSELLQEVAGAAAVSS
jgi:hypothetical protein